MSHIKSLCLLGLLCICTCSPLKNDELDSEKLKIVLDELNLSCTGACPILILPIKGCSSCSNQTVDDLRGITKHEKITIVISGDNTEFLYKVRNSLTGNRIIVDKYALTVQYGLVSIYPVYFYKDQFEGLNKIEVRPTTHIQDVALLKKTL